MAELAIPAATANIASYLPIMAARRPHIQAVVFPQSRDDQGRVAYTHFTFAQLERETRLLAAGLDRLGLKEGERVALMVKPCLDFFSLTFALFQMGAVPVFIDPGIGVRHLKTCLSEAEPHAFIGIAKAQIARILLRWPKFRLLVTVGTRAPWGGHTLAQVRAIGRENSDWNPPPTRPEQMAAILFTSGSTGVPKGAVYSHGIFSAQVEKLKQAFAIEPGEIDLCTFPLFALFAPALGMTAIVPEMDFTRPARVDPERIREAIDQFGCTNMFGSPALLNRVGRVGGERGYRFESLRRVISAGAPVAPAVLISFSKLLRPGVEIFTPYGATESLPVCVMGSTAILSETAALTARGKGVCVGQPVAGMRVEILPIDDGPIERWPKQQLLGANQIGEICVKGDVVTASYYHREQHTKLAKCQDPEGGFWHRMGDLGYRDEQGRIWFCGRKSHRVQTERGTLFTIPVEGVFNCHPAVFRSALVGCGRGPYKRPVLCVELEKSRPAPDPAQLIAELKALGAEHEHTRGIETFLLHPAFPVDIRHNAKIFREKLANWAEGRLSRGA